MKQQSTPKLPKINQFEQQFSQLSLSNHYEQKQNPIICKGMLSQINPKGPCENKKIKQNNQFEQKISSTKRCQQNNESSFELDLSVFKIRPCQRQCEHNFKQCPYFHSENDLRRAGTFYSQELCQFKQENKECPHGYACCKSHNQYEQLYQEDVYRKRFCPQPQNCCFGQFCPYAHDEKDVKCELIHLYSHDLDYFLFHYKTIACPFALINHNLVLLYLIRSTCHYYHNDQDKRRKPNEQFYQPQQCQRFYEKKQCNNDCELFHSIFEYYFHPLIYKTLPCDQQNCQKLFCPGYHNEQDFREISPLIRNGIMKIVPKNRYEEKVQKYQQSLKFPSLY